MSGQLAYIQLPEQFSDSCHLPHPATLPEDLTFINHQLQEACLSLFPYPWQPLDVFRELGSPKSKEGLGWRSEV